MIELVSRFESRLPSNLLLSLRRLMEPRYALGFDLKFGILD